MTITQQNWRVLSLALDPLAWTDVVAPIDCDSFSIGAIGLAVDLHVRVDKTDPATEFIVYAGREQVLSPPPNHAKGLFRWKQGDVLCSIQPTSGTGPALLHCFL